MVANGMPLVYHMVGGVAPGLVPFVASAGPARTSHAMIVPPARSRAASA